MNASQAMEIVHKFASMQWEVTFVHAYLVTTLLQILGLARVGY